MLSQRVVTMDKVIEFADSTMEATSGEFITRIVEIAKEKIAGAGCVSVDVIARLYCDLLTEFGAEEAAKEVYQYYDR